ncbi:hypothetical protein A0256_15435 [Mucilaginibacter sp. PAMC 26640]|nr:hypothetical protein A0256_15435 [Mucilaginibacter sp. PAMC 26640]
MKADALSLAATLNNSEVDIYTIPQYQRPYTWDTQNFEVLWEDLTDAFKEYLDALDRNEQPEYYFLGPVVFVKNAIKRSYDIIDGQQRTTTFHVLLWYLYRRLTDEIEQKRLHQILTFLGKDSKLKVSAKDASTFLKISQNNEEIEGITRMAECANYFRQKVKELSDANLFSAFLRDYTQFIVIVADDYAKAWDLFIGLNGKGEPLNPTDLVKAFVCGRSDVGDIAGSIWEEKILPLKDDSTAFLLFLTRYKSQKFVSENSLFKEITKQFPQTINTLNIAEFSEVFHLFWHVAVEAITKHFPGGLKITIEGKKSLRVLRDLGRRDFTTLIFQYSEAFGRKSIFEEDFLKALASYQIRMAISRKRSRERKFVVWFKDVDFLADKSDETLSQDEILQNNKTKALELIIRTLKADAPDDEQFRMLVAWASYHGNYPARIILRHHEEGERGIRIIHDYQLEHLIPQTGTDYWYAVTNVVNDAGEIDNSAYLPIVNNIGNLFVIDPETNNQVKNKEYEIKKGFYQEYLKDWSIARVTAAKAAWGPLDIFERATTISQWAIAYWKYK